MEWKWNLTVMKCWCHSSLPCNIMSASKRGFRNLICNLSCLYLISFRNLKEFYIHSFNLPAPQEVKKDCYPYFAHSRLKHKEHKWVTRDHTALQRGSLEHHQETWLSILFSPLDRISSSCMNWKDGSQLATCFIVWHFQDIWCVLKWSNVIHKYRTSCYSRRLKFHTWPGPFTV